MHLKLVWLIKYIRVHKLFHTVELSLLRSLKPSSAPAFQCFQFQLHWLEPTDRTKHHAKAENTKHRWTCVCQTSAGIQWGESTKRLTNRVCDIQTMSSIHTRRCRCVRNSHSPESSNNRRSTSHSSSPGPDERDGMSSQRARNALQEPFSGVVWATAEPLYVCVRVRGTTLNNNTSDAMQSNETKPMANRNGSTGSQCFRLDGGAVYVKLRLRNDGTDHINFALKRAIMQKWNCVKTLKKKKRERKKWTTTRHETMRDEWPPPGHTMASCIYGSRIFLVDSNRRWTSKIVRSFS